MLKKLLITAPYFLPVVEEYRERLEQAGYQVFAKDVGERAEEAALLDLIPGVDALVCGDDRVTSRVLDAAKDLRLIVKWGTGIDSIDQEGCKARGITLRNTPNAFTIPVAESVVGYSLALLRRIPEMDLAMKGGEWKKLPGRTLSECQVGIVGVGNIGRRIGFLMSQFGATVVGTDPKGIDSDYLTNVGMRSVSLAELLRTSDIVSVNCDLNPTSHHLINAAALSLMKPDAFLINAARGPIVNEVDLSDALTRGAIAGAGLDVFEHEPLPPSSPLMKMSQVLIAPHNTNSSPRAWKRVHESTVSHLEKFRSNDSVGGVLAQAAQSA